MIDARFVPIEKWPREKTPPNKRKSSPFDVKYGRMLDDLERELRHLGASNVVIQAYFDRKDIRNDGWPRGSARPSEPGVIVGFIKRGGQEISFPCDTYHNYESNLRAIGLTLAALRAIDRYGVTQHNEQYKGWAKLPPAPEVMTGQSALAFLRLYSDIEPRDPESMDRAFRVAARRLHPDNSESGNNNQFIMLQEARAALKREYGW